jgi:hypothetical protein
LGDECLSAERLHCVHEQRVGQQWVEGRPNRETTRCSLCVGDYESVDDAKADLKALKELHREHVVR